MRSGLFSPSLDLRSEPPYSLGIVSSVTKNAKGYVRYASVQFKGRSLRCRSLHINLATGERVAVIEAPRGTYWTRRSGPSWYAKPLADWSRAGRIAQVAMEYFLKDCRKYFPFVALPKDPEDAEDADDTLALWEKKGSKNGKDGRPWQRVGLDDFYDRDENKDGVLTRDEWRDSDGDFDEVDENGDGKITPEEWKKWKEQSDEEPLPEPSVWISCAPSHLPTSGQTVIEWGSTDETDCIVTDNNGGAWFGTSGTASVSVSSTSTFTITGGSGASSSTVCFVGVESVPSWWVYGKNCAAGKVFIVANGVRGSHGVFASTAYLTWALPKMALGQYENLAVTSWSQKKIGDDYLFWGSGELQHVGFSGADECTMDTFWPGEGGYDSSADAHFALIGTPDDSGYEWRRRKRIYFQIGEDAVTTILPVFEKVVWAEKTPSEANFFLVVNYPVIDV